MTALAKSRRQRNTVPHSKDFISIRLDEALKAEFQAAAEVERRSLSSFGRLLLEYAWYEYLKAGSIRGLIKQYEQQQQQTTEKTGE